MWNKDIMIWVFVYCKESLIVDFCVRESLKVIVVNLKLFIIYYFRIFVSRLFISILLGLMKIKNFG